MPKVIPPQAGVKLKKENSYTINYVHLACSSPAVVGVGAVNTAV
jgi:hypothetical protein